MGDDSLPAAVLFWLRIHGRDEFAADGEWEAALGAVASAKDLINPPQLLVSFRLVMA